MSEKISLEQIKALKVDYFKDLDLTCPSVLIQNLYGVEGEQVEQLLKTAIMTQEHLNAAIGLILNALLKNEATFFRQSKVEEQYFTLLTLLDLLAGVNSVINSQCHN